jgi:S-formylglutathione hydrolase
MKRRAFTLLILPLLCLPVAAQDNGGQLIETTIPATSLKSNLLGIPAEQPIAVYLPPSYEQSNRRYPVVYFLTGFGDAIRYYSQYGIYQGFTLKGSLDKLINDEDVGAMIVVVASGSTPMGGSFYVNSPVNGNWEDYVVKDLVNFVDKSYRTIPTAAGRGISGHSMGGYGALTIAMRHPDVFGSVYALSPGLFDSTGLQASPMFADGGRIAAFLAMQKQFDGMKKDESKVRFLGWIAQLFLASGDYETAFACAYGAAFAPNTKRNAPYLDYPYKKAGTKLVVDQPVWKLWQQGFGGLEDKVRKNKERLQRLKGIGIDVGETDETPFVLPGCRMLSQLLKDAEIEHTLVTFDGKHQDKLRERIEEHLLPFFSKALSAE